MPFKGHNHVSTVLQPLDWLTYHLAEAEGFEPPSLGVAINELGDRFSLAGHGPEQDQERLWTV